jgi:hypothetical protein
MVDLPDSERRDPEPRRAQLRAALSLVAREPGEHPPRRADDPALTKVVERQRRVALSLSSAGPATPPGLAARLASLEHAAEEPHRSRAFRVPLGTSWQPRAVAAVVGALALCAALVVLVTSASSGGRLAATRVADLWTLPATSNAVHPSTSAGAELDVSFHGTPYPAYRDREGWHAVGRRSDYVGGKTALTVFYATGARRAAYTVIAGTHVSVPASAMRFVADGVQLAEFNDHGRWIVVFRNHGNSCVLTAAQRERTWLVKLAVWRQGNTPSLA